jgi:hypothetical protein
VDCHPLIREHFAEQLKDTDAWRECHRRLYEHLRVTTPDKPQPTLEDLQPLYEAVSHGCHAGLQHEVYEKVYVARIRQRNEYYTVKKLGALSSELGAVACFFDTPWSGVSQRLRETSQGVLLNSAAACMCAVGRLTEALNPMRAATELAATNEDWKNAATGASNLSELELTLGDVSGAVVDAEQSSTYADRSGSEFWKIGARTTHADALHQAGRRTEAELRFREAEQIQKARQPDYPLTYSLPGFKYCDLLLSVPERTAWRSILSLNVQPSTLNLPDSCRAVFQRAAQTLKWAIDAKVSLLTVALDHLTVGRGEFLSAIVLCGF